VRGRPQSIQILCQNKDLDLASCTNSIQPGTDLLAILLKVHGILLSPACKHE